MVVLSPFTLAVECLGFSVKWYGFYVPVAPILEWDPKAEYGVPLALSTAALNG